MATVGIPPTAVLTERIELTADGGVLPAHLARPADGDVRAGVVVAHELFGLTVHVREVCERLASLGLVVLAPELYHRDGPAIELPHDGAGRDRGFEHLHRLTRAGVLADMAAAEGHLRALGCPSVGVVGLSLGGHVAYLAATALDLDPVVALYPGWLAGTEIGLSRPEPTLTLTAGIRGRVLILSGEEDHAVPAADRDALAGALSGGGVRHELVVYPGAPHGFLCDRRDTYVAAVADDAWARMAALLTVQAPAGARTG